MCDVPIAGVERGDDRDRRGRRARHRAGRGIAGACSAATHKELAPFGNGNVKKVMTLNTTIDQTLILRWSREPQSASFRRLPVGASPVSTELDTLTPAPAAAPQEQGHHAPYVTVVLPCYNEQDHVLAELERIDAALDASGFTYELLVIDDKSTDNTLAVLRGRAPLTRGCGSCLPPQRRFGHGPADRHPGGARARSWSGPTPT